MSQIQDRLAEIFPKPHKRGLQADIARACGVRPPSVSAWFNDREKVQSIERKYAEAICAEYHLDVEPAWLAEGKLPKHKKAQHANGAGEPSNVRDGPKPRRPLPIISWIAAGELRDVEDHYYAGQADDWFSLYETNVGDRAFVLIIEGDSMTNTVPGTGHSFPPGTKIVVDPDMAANAGDYVVAKDVMTQRATFKKLHYEEGRWYLKPLNHRYDMIQIDDPALRVIGKVTDFYTGGKL